MKKDEETVEVFPENKKRKLVVKFKPVSDGKVNVNNERNRQRKGLGI